ncbi:MAG: 50S ribosomal protein L25 [Chloroflexi bacterium]|nr:50S ribosomal protein L25 [Chloroflexota bacterium]
MEKVVLLAETREVTGKQVKALRRSGKLPAVLYGRKLEPIAVSFDAREAGRVLPGITSSQLVTIKVGSQEHTALVREKQWNPILGSLIHVDFLIVSMTEKLRAEVSIVIEGESSAVRDFNGVLVTVIEELEVECLPGDLPERIAVDISVLKEIGAALHVRDIHLSDKVRVLTDLDEVVVIITPPAGEEAAEAAGAAEPEVIERGKKAEEDF